MRREPGGPAASTVAQHILARRSPCPPTVCPIPWSRPDRCRQLFETLFDPGFDRFDRGPQPPLPHLVQMTEYSDRFTSPVAYPSQSVTEVLGLKALRSTA